MDFLTPDARCHALNHRANGYARGEGIAVNVLKLLSQAMEDDDLIRAVISGTGMNQDGRSPGMSKSMVS